MDFIKNNDELIQTLKDGGVLKLPWRSKLSNLHEKGIISDGDYAEYTERHLQHQSQQQKIIKDLVEAKKVNTSIEAAKCDDCNGSPINAGTYGYIFNSNDPNIVIKASMNAHSEAFGCPSEFTKEIEAYQAIYNSIDTRNLNLIKLVDVYGDLWVEKRRCYYRMEKLFPIVLNDKQKVDLHESIEQEKDDTIKYSLESLRDDPELYMLTPGITNPKIHFGVAGGQHSNWREINLPIIEKFFNILGIDIDKYLEDLESIVNQTLESNIELIDVEFMLCSVITGTNDDGSLKKENKLVMIDFDKVKLNQPIPNKNVVMNQDMFVYAINDAPETPKRVRRSSISEPVSPKKPRRSSIPIQFMGGKNKLKRTKRNRKSRKSKKSRKSRKSRKSKKIKQKGKSKR